MRECLADNPVCQTTGTYPLAPMALTKTNGTLMLGAYNHTSPEHLEPMSVCQTELHGAPCWGVT